MKATYLHGAGDVRVADAPDPTIQLATDALVRVVRACVCGSDLHPFHDQRAGEVSTLGHEFIGVIEAVGAAVTTVAPGDFVIAPFAISCGECEFCRAGLQTSCVNGGFWNSSIADGGQAQAVRVPLADGTLVAVPGVGENADDALLASLLTLSDVYGTGRHASRTDLGREFGATDVVAERGEAGVAAVRDLTDGGSAIVLEAVGHMPALEQAIGVVRPGGAISRVGVPQYDLAPLGWSVFGPNITVTGGPAPVRAYIERLLPGVLDGTVNPGRVFDRTYALDDIASAYADMDARTTLKALVRP